MARPTKIKAYSQNIGLVDIFPFPVFKTSSPTASDKIHEVGQVWIYKNGDARSIYVFAGLDSSGDAVWALSSTGTGDLETLSGDTGGAINPTVESIVLAGGTNITTAGTSAPGTITFDLDDAIEVATSVTSPLFNAPAATTMNITAAAGQDINLNLGDSAGANYLNVQDSSGADIINVTSSVVSFSGLDISSNGNFDHRNGSFDVGLNNASDGIIIGAGNIARSITMGQGTAAHTVDIGTASAGEISISSGSNLLLTAQDIICTIGDNGGATSFTIQDSDGLDIVDFASDATTFAGLTIDSSGGFNHTIGSFNVGLNDGGSDVNLGGGDIARVITLGSGTGQHEIDIGHIAADSVIITSGFGVNLTAPAINISGDLKITDRNKLLQMIGGGSTDFIGTATLIAGTVTINNTNIGVKDRIFIQRQSINGSSSIGHFTYSISVGANFQIKSVQTTTPASTQTNDTSIIMYWIVREN